MLTREEAKERMINESIEYKNGLKTVSLRKINKFINEIFYEHEAEMKAKEEEIGFLKSQINAKPTPESIIAKIRNSFYHATVVYTRGSCGQLYKILKEIFPDAEAYENGDHVITKIGDKFWDIKGEVARTQGFKLCEPNNALLSNYFGNDLQHIQCPNCDEVFYCGDEDEKDNA